MSDIMETISKEISARAKERRATRKRKLRTYVEHLEIQFNEIEDEEIYDLFRATMFRLYADMEDLITNYLK